TDTERSEQESCALPASRSRRSLNSWLWRRKRCAAGFPNNANERRSDMSRKRRGRGEGSISQRADGLWEAKVSLGYDGQGKRRRKTVYGKTKAEVQEKLRETQTDLKQGVDISAGQITLAQWLTRWLVMVKPTVEPNTYGPYERHVRLHIVPLLGN